MKKGKKYNEFSLDSFTEEADGGEDSNIAIYTDSRDRLPELDKSEDNPFYVKKSDNATSGGQSSGSLSKRRKGVGQTKKDAKVEETLKREDGMIYVL